MIVKRFDYFLHIATPGGQTVSISRDDHASCVRQAQIWLSGLKEISLYDAWFANLSSAIRRAGNCHVPVRRAGNGSTERSCKPAVTVCWSLGSSGQEGEPEHGQHTLTLPKSLICTDEAGLVWFPSWALKKNVDGKTARFETQRLASFVLANQVARSKFGEGRVASAASTARAIPR